MVAAAAAATIQPLLSLSGIETEKVREPRRVAAAEAAAAKKQLALEPFFPDTLLSPFLYNIGGAAPGSERSWKSLFSLPTL